MICFLLDEHVNPAIQRQLRLGTLRQPRSTETVYNSFYCRRVDARRMVQSIRLFLLIVSEKIGKIPQVTTFESVPTISGWLVYLW